MRYIKVVLDGDDGSRFEEVEVAQAMTPYTANVPALLVSEPIAVSGVVFVTLPEELRETDWHPAPRRQFVVLTDGDLELQTTDGDVRRLRSGMFALLEDTSGRGHKTTVCGRRSATFMAIPLVD